jgi:hypothetical protein
MFDGNSRNWLPAKSLHYGIFLVQYSNTHGVRPDLRGGNCHLCTYMIGHTRDTPPVEKYRPTKRVQRLKRKIILSYYVSESHSDTPKMASDSTGNVRYSGKCLCGTKQAHLAYSDTIEISACAEQFLCVEDANTYSTQRLSLFPISKPLNFNVLLN